VVAGWVLIPIVYYGIRRWMENAEEGPAGREP
jgi:hypothetical protein